MFNKHFIYFSFFLFLFFSFIFHTHIPPIWPDEVLFFNPAFELGINGVMRTSVLDGLIPGMDTHTLWMPPTFMVLLSLLLKVFPANLLTARLFSTFVSLGSLFLVYQISKSLRFSLKRIGFILFFIATDLVFLKFSHTSRMESLCSFFALSAFYFLLKSKNQTDHNELDPTKSDLFFSAVSLSLSFLSHPFGIVHSLPILFLLYQRNSFTPWRIFLYCIGGLIPLTAWLFYIIPNLDLFVIQFGAQLSRKNELLGKFNWIDKVKIIFSVYKFPLIKLSLYFVTVFMFAFYFIKTKFKDTNKAEYFIKLIKTDNEFFALIWLLTITTFLFLSSEFWYVFHMTVPFVLILSYLLSEIKLSRYFVYLSIGYNVFIIIWIIVSSFFIYKLPEKVDIFFSEIEKVVEAHNNVYLQAIPDPYFYLKEKFPNKNIREFIPGELSGLNKSQTEKKSKSLLVELGVLKDNYKIDESFYYATIEKQDVFIFYNENLMNPYIKKHLEKNSAFFERKIISVETPKGSDLKLEAVAFVKKQKN
ncbi:MAG TPA: hypothetical protein PKL30_00420 [Leptospiraceae bacterium]|nr:hypothetical protein [Leptospiraceae bacterium]